MALGDWTSIRLSQPVLLTTTTTNTTTPTPPGVEKYILAGSLAANSGVAPLQRKTTTVTSSELASQLSIDSQVIGNYTHPVPGGDLGFIIMGLWGGNLVI